MQKPAPIDVEREVTSIDMIVSKGDAQGNITYTNPIFMKISGYSQGELLDKPHSILRHPDMPKAIFKFLWDNISEGKEVNAYVKNLCKDGSYYWVFAQVRMAKNPDGSFRNYVSTRKSMSEGAKAEISELYATMLEAEKAEGIDASVKVLESYLTQKGHSLTTFNECMKELNK
jgi:PAS domain S-box-containing protein